MISPEGNCIATNVHDYPCVWYGLPRESTHKLIEQKNVKHKFPSNSFKISYRTLKIRKTLDYQLESIHSLEEENAGNLSISQRV